MWSLVPVKCVDCVFIRVSYNYYCTNCSLPHLSCDPHVVTSTVCISNHCQVNRDKGKEKNKEKSIITQQVWHSSKGSSFSYLWRNFLTSMTTAGVENNKSKEWRLHGIGEEKGEWRRFEQRIQFHNWEFYLSHDPPFYMLIILVIISIIIHFLCNMHNLFCCTYYIFM